MTNEGYSTMCGHGVIALTTALLETGAIAEAEPSTQVARDTPAGRIIARATVTDGKVVNVAFHNVPAFRYAADIDVQIANRSLKVDVAWDGAFYALVDAQDLGAKMTVENVSELMELGMAVKRAVAVAVDVAHPTDPRLSGLYGTIISVPSTKTTCHGENITNYASGAVDRSPCGTGTSATLAVLHETGQLGMHQSYLHESIIGTIFEGRITGQASFGGRPAVTTEISGRGFITSFHQFVLHPDDPTAPGFFIR